MACCASDSPRYSKSQQPGSNTRDLGVRSPRPALAVIALYHIDVLDDLAIACFLPSNRRTCVPRTGVVTSASACLGMQHYMVGGVPSGTQPTSSGVAMTDTNVGAAHDGERSSRPSTDIKEQEVTRLNQAQTHTGKHLRQDDADHENASARERDPAGSETDATPAATEDHAVGGSEMVSSQKAEDEGSASDNDRKHVGQRQGRSRDDQVPACLLRVRDGAEACSSRAQQWADAQDEKAMQRQRRRAERSDGGVRFDEETGAAIEPRGDPCAQRKGMIVVVAVILIWVYIVFTWRICVRSIRNDPGAVATRTEGIGLLVGFHLLWLIAIWSYVKVFTTGPGFARDYVPITEPPPSPVRPTPVQETVDASPSSTQTIRPVQNEEKETPRPDDPKTHLSSSEEQHKSPDGQQTLLEALEPSHNADPGPLDASSANVTDTFDPAIPAFVGPLGATMLAQRDEHERVVAEEGAPRTDQNTCGPVSSEPMRKAPEGLPLHPSSLYCYRCRRVKPPRAHHCRHCGTCVLKMDHHCPWVGGCVGAQNHKYFFNFLVWVTMLEIFTLITNAYLFTRDVYKHSHGLGEVDGYMISLFPITATFTLFTAMLVGLHAYLFLFNLTTIEHLLFERFKVREAVDLDDYLDDKSRANGQPKLRWLERQKEIRTLRIRFAHHWGSLRTETNPWWVDGKRRGPRFGLQGAFLDIDNYSATKENDEALLALTPWWRAAPANWRENMGDNRLGWILPIGSAKNAKGYEYPFNWRFTPSAQWTERARWPQRWRDVQSQAREDARAKEPNGANEHLQT